MVCKTLRGRSLSTHESKLANLLSSSFSSGTYAIRSCN